ncbi:MAG: hypothetical protein RIB84_00655 [Sneathiellaceae bacterium]
MKSETRMRTPGVGGCFRELPDGSFEEVPEGGEAPAPAKPARAAKRGKKTAEARTAPPAPLPLPGPGPAPGRDTPADVTGPNKEDGDDAVGA